MDENAIINDLVIRISELNSEFQKMAEHMAKHNKSLGIDEKITIKSLKMLEDQLKLKAAETKSVKDSTEKLLKLNESIEELNSEIDVMQESAQKNAKKEELAQKQAEAKEVSRSLRKEIGGKTAAKVIEAGAAGLFNAMKQATQSALHGGSAIDISADFLKGGIDTINNSVQAGATGFQKMGESMTASGNKWGMAVSLGAAALGAFSRQISEAAKAGIDFMIKQTNNLINQFQHLSSIGAVYAGGLDSLMSTSVSAGMTLDQFSKAVIANKDNLVKTGLGIAEASKKMAAAMASGGAEARRSMFALGMSMDDQASATAEAMALMAGPTGQLRASNAQVAQETQTYAANLKTLSDLTGEDMKSKQEKIRQENDTLAFQQKLDGMDEKQRLAVQTSMLAMSDTQRKALRENMIYGTIISKDVAVAQATNSALGKTNDAFARMAKDGTMNVDNVLKVQGENSDEMHRVAMANRGLAMAGAAGGADAAQAAKDQLETDQLLRKLSLARTDVEKKKILGEMKAGKEGTSTGANLLETNQNFAVSLQKIASDNLPEFAKALQTTIDTIGQSVLALAKVSVDTGTSLGGWFAKHAATLINTGMLATGGVLTATGVGAGIGIPLMEAGGAGLAGQMTSPQGFADGGITSGSKRGHTELMHGTELVVPISGGKLDTKSKGYADLLRVASQDSAASTTTSSSPRVASQDSAASTTTSSSLRLDYGKMVQQLINEIKQMNQYLSTQEKDSLDLQMLIKRLVDTSERHLSVADNAAKNAA